MKSENNIPKAIHLFREALSLNPEHEDAFYYLAQCLAGLNEFPEALDHLRELKRINPQSHRAFLQWGRLRALSAKSKADLEAAEKSLKRAFAINPEETGGLLLLGETAILLDEYKEAQTHLEHACRSNPRAAAGFYLRGYLAWKQGDEVQARALLGETREALGPEWKPKGTTSEGDVREKWHTETSVLSHLWENWDGDTDPQRTFQTAEDSIKQFQARLDSKL